MKETRFTILLGSVWEIVRFLALFAAVLGLGLPEDRGSTLWLLFFGSGQLVLAAAFLFLFLDPPRYHSLRPFLVLGKGLGLFSALLLVLLEPLPSFALAAPVRLFSLRIPPAALLWVVALFDLAVMGFLLTGRGATARPEDAPPAPPAPHGDPDPHDLPEFRETRVEDPPPR